VEKVNKYIKEMLFARVFKNILAIVLPSLRISPLLLIRVVTIVSLYVAALSFNVVYIQSIGSYIGIFSALLISGLLSPISLAYLLLTSYCSNPLDCLDLSMSTAVAVVTYSNAFDFKESIIKDNKNKVGIYRWINLINNKSYIGSSMNLGSRLRDYLKISYLNIHKDRHMIIYQAILKYGYGNFKVEILEYCEIDELRAREQYYLDLLEPEYNTLKVAGSALGHKHSPEALAKVRFHLSKLNAEKSFKVAVTNIETNTAIIYDSIRKAAEALNCDKKTITYWDSMKLKGKPFRGKFEINIIK